MTDIDVDEIADTGGHEVITYMTMLNAIFGDETQRSRVTDALEASDGDLRGALVNLTDQEIPEHIGHYLDQAEPYIPMLVGAMRCFASGAATTVQLGPTSDHADAPDLAVAMTSDQRLVLTIRQLIRLRG